MLLIILKASEPGMKAKEIHTVAETGNISKQERSKYGQ